MQIIDFESDFMYAFVKNGWWRLVLQVVAYSQNGDGNVPRSQVSHSCTSLITNIACIITGFFLLAKRVGPDFGGIQVGVWRPSEWRTTLAKGPDDYILPRGRSDWPNVRLLPGGPEGDHQTGQDLLPTYARGKYHARHHCHSAEYDTQW